MNRKLKRTLPYITLLKDTPDHLKKKRLATFPEFVLDDIIEILYNILYRNINVRNAKHMSSLLKNKNTLSRIVGAHKQKSKRRKLMRQQSGGFLAAILPILAATLSSIL